MNNDINNNCVTRRFLVMFNPHGIQYIEVGTCGGKKPKQAANKALSMIIKNYNIQDSTLIKFKLIETTKHSKNKTSFYSGERTRLSNPITLNVNGKEIKYIFQNTIKKITSYEYNGEPIPEIHNNSNDEYDDFY